MDFFAIPSCDCVYTGAFVHNCLGGVYFYQCWYKPGWGDISNIYTFTCFIATSRFSLPLPRVSVDQHSHLESMPWRSISDLCAQYLVQHLQRKAEFGGPAVGAEAAAALCILSDLCLTRENVGKHTKYLKRCAFWFHYSFRSSCRHQSADPGGN